MSRNKNINCFNKTKNNIRILLCSIYITYLYMWVLILEDNINNLIKFSTVYAIIILICIVLLLMNEFKENKNENKI